MYQIKPTLNVSNLINKISTKYNVKINNISKAQSYLTHINYYRLSEYLVKLSVTEPGIDFEKILKYYDFDRLMNFNSSTSRAYFDLIDYYLTLIAPEHTFMQKLNEHIYKYVSKYKLCLNHWGFESVAGNQKQT